MNVELWSSGLQGTGGVIEIVGIAALYLEWLKNRHVEEGRHARRRPRSVAAALHPRGQAGGEDDPTMTSVREMERARDDALRAEEGYVKESEGERTRMYVFGVGVTLLGVVVQIAGNAVAWCAAWEAT